MNTPFLRQKYTVGDAYTLFIYIANHVFECAVCAVCDAERRQTATESHMFATFCHHRLRARYLDLRQVKT